MNPFVKWWLRINRLLPCPANEPEPARWLVNYIPAGAINDLAAWIDYNIPWTKDRAAADEWKPPARTIVERAGDCEDLALVAQMVVNTWKNWRADIVFLKYDPAPGHVVAAFTDPNGQKYFMENKIIPIADYSEIPAFFRRARKKIVDAYFYDHHTGIKKSLDNLKAV